MANKTNKASRYLHWFHVTFHQNQIVLRELLHLPKKFGLFASVRSDELANVVLVLKTS